MPGDNREGAEGIVGGVRVGVGVGAGVGDGGADNTPLTKLKPFALHWEEGAQPRMLHAFTHQ